MIKKTPFNIDTLPAPEAGFPRGMELKTGNMRILIISGTSSVGPKCETMYPGDFEAQARHTLKNIKDLLSSRGFEVRDVIRWRIYLSDIAKYYDRFNKIRDEYFLNNGITRENMAASSCVEAKICREDLTVEIEADALREDG